MGHRTKYGIEHQLRLAMKGQFMVDFIVEVLKNHHNL